MSWDISIQKFERTYSTFDELNDDTQALPLGRREAVQVAVSRAFPGTDWSDPGWGRFDAPFGSVEFNSGTDDPVDSIMLHVRASDAVVPAIVRCAATTAGRRWTSAAAGSSSSQRCPKPDCGLGASIEIV